MQDNENLRTLSSDNHYDSGLSTFSDPVLVPVLSRLRTVSVDFSADEVLFIHKDEILAILRVLPENSYLTVTQIMDNVDENSGKIPVPPRKVSILL